MNTVVKTFLSLVYVLLFGFFFSFQTPSAYALDQAQAIIRNTEDNTVMGQVDFLETYGGVFMDVTMINSPPGLHGIHIHENGSCEDGAKAAGGHFNPDGVKHGILIKDGLAAAHAGDLGNIRISDKGTGLLREDLPLSLTEGKYAIVGRSIILHAQADDLSQPTGNAGDRLGCGVIVQQ
jgi:Cu-Zn family superoxide dismutase